ncbi:TetR family regulatory protein of MDR cluster [Nocardiopsis sp. JB363]|nr:TetR family regulatory protein of MDR cluster [Nocardiopsis sp. JB363]
MLWVMNPDDPRVRRTRQRLRAALLSLAAEQELASVTMAAVARRAEVNRATAYQHYADLDGLVADAMEDAVAHVARCAALCPLETPNDRTPEPLIDLFAHVAENAVLYRRMFAERGSARFAELLRERVAGALVVGFTEGRRPTAQSKVPPELHASFVAGALVGVVAASADGGRSPAVDARDTWLLLTR